MSSLNSAQVSQSPPSIEELVQEIQKTPAQEWNYLLQILKLFRQSLEPVNVEISEKNQAAIRLLKSWRDTDDEQEQQETWEFLRQALDENRLSDRPLFPS